MTETGEGDVSLLTGYQHHASQRGPRASRCRVREGAVGPPFQAKARGRFTPLLPGHTAEMQFAIGQLSFAMAHAAIRV